MHILHVINDLNKGGAERLLVDNLPIYNKSGMNVEVLQISNKNSEPKYIELLQSNGVSCHHLSSTTLYNPLLIIKLVTFFRRQKFDVIHVHLFPALYWVAIASRFLDKKTKLVFTEHSTQNKRSRHSLLQPVEKAIYKCYDKIIAISEQINQKLVNWTSVPEKTITIRNGIDTKKFAEATRYDTDYFHREFAIPRNGIMLLMTARFSYPKDHTTLVKALHQLPDNYYLILVGEGPNREDIQSLAEQLKISHRVIFTGFRNDIPSLMKSVNVNILSTEYEGMSGVSLEALASGTPFIGSDVAGINDLVPDSRYLFVPGSPSDISEKIQQIISDTTLSNEMSIDGSRHAKGFDISIHVKKHYSLYYELINA